MVERVTENRVTASRMSGERLVAADYGAAGQLLGKAVENFGSDLHEVAKNVDEIQQKYDVAAVHQADAEDQQTIGRIRGTALSAKGFDAQSAVTQARTDIAGVKKARMSLLKTPRQRQLYSTMFDERNAGYEAQFTEHSIKQVDAANTKASTDAAETAMGIAVQSYDQPEIFTANINTMRAHIAELHKGETPESVAHEQDQATSKVYASVIENMLTDPSNVSKANLYFHDNASKITDPTDYARVLKTLNPLMREERAANNAARIEALSVGHADAGEVAPHEDAAPDAPAMTRPIKGSGYSPVGGKPGNISSGFTASRPGGRQHGADDYPAPAGTPIRPPMSGKVIKSWLSPEGGWSVLIQHPNGMVSGYAHMKSQSPLSVGDAVTRDTVIGGVGNTGAGSHGNHVHFTVRNAAGVRIDPQSAHWGGGDQIAPKVDAQGIPDTSDHSTIDGPGKVSPNSVSWKEPALTRFTSDEHTLSRNLTTLYNTATREGWSRQDYEDAADVINKHAAVNDRLHQQTEKDTIDHAWSLVSELESKGPQGFTSVSQLGSAFGVLPGREQVALRSRARENLTGGVKANGADFADLIVASMDPSKSDAFQALNINAINTITPGERTQLLKRQQELRNEGTGGKLSADHSRIFTAIGRYAPPFTTDGKETDQDRIKRGKLFETVRAEVERQQRDKKVPLTDDELEAIVKRNVVSIVRHTPRLGGWASEKTETIPRYLQGQTPKGSRDVATLSIDQVPAVDRQQITESFRRSRGVMPTEIQILQLYAKRLGGH